MNDDTTKRLRDIVHDKVAAGVEVKMIVDDAALYTTFSSRDPACHGEVGRRDPHLQQPVALPDVAGSRGYAIHQLQRFGKVALKRRFHEKFMVVDGTSAVLGGMNWGTKYALGGTDDKWWRDTDVYLTGPVVGDIQRRFLNDLFVFRALRDHAPARVAGRSPARTLPRRGSGRGGRVHRQRGRPPLLPRRSATTGAADIRYVGHKPWDESKVPLTNAMLQLIRSAQHTIYWGCHGVRPPRVVAENLADAAARGVEVHLITNSRRSSRSLMGHGLLGWMYWECSHYFRWLIEHGIHVYEWQKQGAFHSKNMVVDDEIAAVGSYNVANGSTFHHTESAVYVYGGEFPHEVTRQFGIDLQSCKEVTLATAVHPWRWVDPMRRPLHERNLLIDTSVLPDAVAHDLQAGKFIWKYADPPPSAKH